jgi:hypothetical protein
VSKRPYEKPEAKGMAFEDVPEWILRKIRPGLEHSEEILELCATFHKEMNWILCQRLGHQFIVRGDREAPIVFCVRCLEAAQATVVSLPPEFGEGELPN